MFLQFWLPAGVIRNSLDKAGVFRKYQDIDCLILFSSLERIFIAFRFWYLSKLVNKGVSGIFDSILTHCSKVFDWKVNDIRSFPDGMNCPFECNSFLFSYRIEQFLIQIQVFLISRLQLNDFLGNFTGPWLVTDDFTHDQVFQWDIINYHHHCTLKTNFTDIRFTNPSTNYHAISSLSFVSLINIWQK